MADLISMLAAAAGAAAGGGEVDPNFNQTTLLLHGDGTNGAQNNTFLDSSTNNFTITRNGNTTQGTFSPFSVAEGQWSAFFDNSGDYITGSTTTLGGGTVSTFTIDGWIYPTSFANTIFVIGDMQPTSTLNYFSVDVLTSGLVRLFWFDGATKTCTSTDALTLNQWNYFAVRVSSNAITLFVNSASSGQTGTTTLTNRTSTVNFALGAFNGSATPNAYFSNIRVSTVARTIAVPTSPFVNDSDTRLLLLQSNRFVNNGTTASTLTIAGNTRVTPFSPFAPTAAYDASVNGGSGYFDGTGDYLSIADAAGLRFGTGNFTIQCWIYRNAAGAVHSIAAKGGASTGWVFQVHSDNKLRFTHTTTNIDSTGTISASSWTHVAVVREGTGTNQVKLYINGVNDGQGTVSTDFNQTEQLNIGANRGNSSVMNGYIAGLKYVVGTAETITVPTAPPTGGTALLNFTNAGIFDNTGKNNLETVADTQIDTAIKKYGTGSIQFDGTGDQLYIASSPELALGTGDFTVEMWYYENSGVSGNKTLFDTRTVAGATNGLSLQRIDTLNLRVFTNASVVTTGNSTIVQETWQHIAVVRQSGTIRIYLDGVEKDNAANTQNFTNTDCWIGDNADESQKLNGYLDDIRVTKGVCRYPNGTTFTPPTKAFPDL